MADAYVPVNPIAAMIAGAGRLHLALFVRRSRRPAWHRQRRLICALRDCLTRTWPGRADPATKRRLDEAQAIIDRIINLGDDGGVPIGELLAECLGRPLARGLPLNTVVLALIGIETLRGAVLEAAQVAPYGRELALLDDLIGWLHSIAGRQARGEAVPPADTVALDLAFVAAEGRIDINEIIMAPTKAQTAVRQASAPPTSAALH
jgi:hypothetical protein